MLPFKIKIIKGRSVFATFKLALFVLMLCFGQMSFAGGWGGLSGKTPGGTNYGEWGDNSTGNTVTGSPSSANSGASLGSAYGKSRYTTSACGCWVTISASGGCSGYCNQGGAGCGTRECWAGITMNANATQRCVISYSGGADSSNNADGTQYVKVNQYLDWSSANPGTKNLTDPANSYSVSAWGHNSNSPANGSGITPTYWSDNTTICDINASGQITNKAAGWCKVYADVAGNAHWTDPASKSMQWYIRGVQTITVTNDIASSLSVLGQDTVAATTDGPGGVTIVASEGCAGGGVNTATITGVTAGVPCKVTFSAGQSDYYMAATPVERFSGNITKGSQTLTFPAQASQAFVPGKIVNISPLATSNSGLLVSYNSATPAVCTVGGIGGNKVTLVSGGTCTINATQAGNTNWNAATPVPRSFAITPGPQTITVTTPAPASVEKNVAFGVAASASSGLGVSIVGSGDCTGSGTGTATITPNAQGTDNCIVTYTQSGNTSYAAAAQKQSTSNITLTLQTINVTQAAPGEILVGTPFDVVANATSGLDVTIAVSGDCTISGGPNTATIELTSGTTYECDVTYSQAGNGVYEPAPSITTKTSAIRTAQVITVGTPAPASAIQNANFTVAASSDSGLGVAITTSGGCSGSGTNSASITMDSRTQACVVHYNQAGNSTYAPANEVTNLVADATAPTIFVVKQVDAETSGRPRFEFASNEAGTIIYSGSCISATVSAGAGTNIIVMDEMELGTYSDCSLLVKDAAGNQSNSLSLNTFTVIEGVVAYLKPVAAGTGDCSSWANACADLQAAIDTSAVTEIWMTAGVYKPSATIVLKPGISIYGGFIGKEKSRNQLNLQPFATDYYTHQQGNGIDATFSLSLSGLSFVGGLTIISADVDDNDVVDDGSSLVLNQADINGSNLSRLFTANNLLVNDSAAVVLSGLVLNAASGSMNGAGLYVSNSLVFANDVQFVALKGTKGAAVAVANGGQLLSTNGTFLRNQSTQAGGAINSSGNNQNKVTVLNALFDSNIAGTDGGAISHESGYLQVLNSTFYANSLSDTTGDGGAINFGGLASPGTADIKYATFKSNRAGTEAASNGRGGAISILAGAAATGVVQLSNSLIVENFAAAGANIAGMDNIIDNGYNIVGYNGISGMVSGAGNATFEFEGTSVTAPTVLVEDILYTSPALNNGATASLKLTADSYARDMIPNIHADCGAEDAVGEDQRGFSRPEIEGYACDVGAIEMIDESACADPDREQGTYIGVYPVARTFCAGNSSLVLSGHIGVAGLLLIMLSGCLIVIRRRSL